MRARSHIHRRSSASGRLLLNEGSQESAHALERAVRPTTLDQRGPPGEVLPKNQSSASSTQELDAIGSPALQAAHVLRRAVGSGWLHAPSGAHMAHSRVRDENKTVVCGSIGGTGHKHYLAMLAWGVLLAITLVLASLLQAVAATVLVVPDETPRSAALQPFLGASPEERRSNLEFDQLYGVPTTLLVETLYATPESCSVPATDGKACIS